MRIYIVDSVERDIDHLKDILTKIKYESLGICVKHNTKIEDVLKATSDADIIFLGDKLGFFTGEDLAMALNNSIYIVSISLQDHFPRGYADASYLKACFPSYPHYPGHKDVEARCEYWSHSLDGLKSILEKGMKIKQAQ